MRPARCALEHAASLQLADEPPLQIVRRLVDVRAEPLEHVADADVHVLRLREHVRVAFRAAVSVGHPERLRVDAAQRLARRLLHHVDGDARRRPPGVDAEPARDDAVDPVGGDDERRLELPAVTRADPHAVA